MWLWILCGVILLAVLIGALCVIHKLRKDAAQRRAKQEEFDRQASLDWFKKQKEHMKSQRMER